MEKECLESTTCTVRRGEGKGYERGMPTRRSQRNFRKIRPQIVLSLVDRDTSSGIEQTIKAGLRKLNL